MVGDKIEQQLHAAVCQTPAEVLQGCIPAEISMHVKLLDGKGRAADIFVREIRQEALEFLHQLRDPLAISLPLCPVCQMPIIQIHSKPLAARSSKACSGTLSSEGAIPESRLSSFSHVRVLI
jgi:hypothetical protein